MLAWRVIGAGLLGFEFMLPIHRPLILKTDLRAMPKLGAWTPASSYTSSCARVA